MSQPEISQQSTDWRTANLDYFLSRPEDMPLRDAYMQRGLIPTNNLGLYIVDNPSPEYAPGTGIPNPYDYRQLPFGPMIKRLQAEQPELWQAAKRAGHQSSELAQQYWAIITEAQRTAGEEAEALGVKSDEAMWAKEEAYNQVIETLAPWLEEAGIRPLDLCI